MTALTMPPVVEKAMDSTFEAPVHPPSDSDSDYDEDSNTTSKSPRYSDRRRIQDAKFSAWLSERQQKVTKEEVKAVLDNANEELLSIRNLMAKQESDLIITSPREYQLELFERAKNQNIIAVLDTGPSQISLKTQRNLV